jgi:hypothetical protein
MTGINLKALPEFPEHWSGGQKITIQIRVLKRTYTSVYVTPRCTGMYPDSLPAAWLPLSRIVLYDGNCLGEMSCILPLSLYRKLRAELSA